MANLFCDFTMMKENEKIPNVWREFVERVTQKNKHFSQ